MVIVGALAVLVQDFSMHEYREQEKLSSDTSNISIDQYNLTLPSSALLDSQSVSSETTSTNKPEVATGITGTPEKILRRPQNIEDYGMLRLAKFGLS